MKLALLCLGLALVAAGCTNVYESGTGSEGVDCDVQTNEEQLDDGQTNPLRCERAEDDGDHDATDGTPREEPGGQQS
ncbi:MAG TPA: hypothetical protein VFH78_04020 [Candidatus Thermoplasmatota archaeon]|nr:hypothetical protein [Candidatus Thermoplasmatota archaeon]